MKQVAVLFPGIGSEYIGMGKSFYERYETARNTFEEAGDVLKLDMKKLCFEGSLDLLKKPENSQPAMLMYNIAVFRVYMQEIGIEPVFLAGHSSGEMSALVCGGAVKFSDALRLLRWYGSTIPDIISPDTGSMALVSGVEISLARELCNKVSHEENGVVVISNYNSYDQFAVSGQQNAVKLVGRHIKERGGVFVPIKSGLPFHSPMMQPAADRFKDEIEKYNYNPLKYTVISNVTALPVDSSQSIIDTMLKQLVSPVLWQQSIKYIREAGVDTAIEISPLPALKNLIKKNAPGMDVFSIHKAENIIHVMESGLDDICIKDTGIHNERGEQIGGQETFSYELEEDTINQSIIQIESRIKKICCKVLEIGGIGSHDNFNDCGVDSIYILPLQEELEKEFPNAVDLVDLYSFPTIHYLARHIGRKCDLGNMDRIVESDESEIDTLLEQVTNGIISREEAKKRMKGSRQKYFGECEGTAVIGMACKFPGARNIDEYWKILKNGEDCIREFSEARKRDIRTYFYKTEGVDIDEIDFKGGFLEDIDKFDAKFFRVSPREAKNMDPLQRLFLETAYEAAEDAGYGGEGINGTRTGVFVGNDHTNASRYKNMVKPDEMLMTGSWSGILASRISYILNLKGPAVVLDTACSSGAMAVHQACRALTAGDCDMAVAGGICLIYSPSIQGGSFALDLVESSDNAVKAFDKDANGTVWGEGVGVVLLKPLNKALEDGDNIHAVIKGTAANNDGTSNGITAPSAKAQEELLVSAWKDAGINPESVSYIETHGTGTILGDPIEIKGLTNAFGRFTQKKQFCGIGSVKTNIGHCVAASGLASLIKVVLSLKYGEIPASLHFKEPNPYIDFNNSPVYVNKCLSRWESDTRPRRAGISAFGFSGTNTHLVVEEAFQLYDKPKNEKSRPCVLLLSAKSKTALKILVKKFNVFVENMHDLDIRDICYTSCVGRGHYGHRLAIVSETEDEIKQRLQSACELDFENDIHGENGVYFKEHRVMSKEKENLQRGEYSEEEITEMSCSAEEILKEYIENGAEDGILLGKLCSLYIEGAAIKWALLYRGEKRRRVSMPVYPLERVRYWGEPRYGMSDIIHEEKDSLPKGQNIKAAIQDEAVSVNYVISGKREEDLTETERKIAAVWAGELGLQEIDIYEDFYHLGGDSILAIRVTNAINQLQPFHIVMSDLFDYSTVSTLASYLDGKAKDVDYAPLSSGESGETGGVYELTHAQKRIWFLQKYDPDMVVYNIPGVMPMSFEVDTDVLEKTINALIKRHSSLRTVFMEQEDGTPVQMVLEDYEYSLEVEDLSSFTDKETFLSDWTRQRNKKPLSLSEPPYIIRLFKMNGSDYRFYMNIHHIITDGWSMGIYCREMLKIYEDYIHGKPVDVKPVKPGYIDWMLQQKEWEKSLSFSDMKEYWKNELLKPLPVLNLPADFGRPKVQTYNGSYVRFTMSGELTGKLKNAARENNTTLHIVLMACYFLLLHRITSDEDIIVGIPISGRDNKDMEKVVGLFVNTLCLRVNIQDETTFRDLLKEVRMKSINAYKNSRYPFELLVSDINPERSSNRNPVFSTMFYLYDIMAPDNDGTSMFDLNFICREVSGGIEARIEYNTDLFKKDTIERISEYYLRLSEHVVREPMVKCIDVEMLSSQEKRKLLFELNRTQVPYPEEKTLHGLFEEQAIKTPDCIALTFKEKNMTYRELNENANRVAGLLTDRGIKNGDQVGLIAERDFGMIVGMLGILKCGGAYVPIDPSYPESRKEYIALHSKVSAVLCDKEERTINSGLPYPIIYFDYTQLEKYPAENRDIQKDSHDLAYIIYTSGSTGNPKGVMIEHHSVVNLISWVNGEFEVGPGDSLLFVTSMCFDLSVYDIFGILACGGRVVIANKEQIQNPGELRKVIREEKITFWDSVPTTMDYLVNAILEEESDYIQSNLRIVFLSGDWIPVKLPRRIKAHFPNAQVISLGGATEATVWSNYFPIDATFDYQTSIPYGRPIDNNYFYILDKSMNPVPQGVAGELYIGGTGVARGYMNDPERTEASFFKNKFLCSDNERMYKTGDLGRLMPDGNIEFLGRIDHQVKIRGFRVELGEIETLLLKNECVKEAVVTDRTDKNGNKYLCAYIVWNKEIPVAGLKDILASELPDYMIPGAFVTLEQIPLTVNGKVDRKALPIPDGMINTGVPYEAPRDGIEDRLVQIWKEILSVEKIGIHDNFFELGGHSLQAALLITRIHKILNVKIALREVFDAQTLKELAGRIRTGKESLYSSIEPVEMSDYYPVSAAQKRLYILNQFDGLSTGYNMTGAVTLEGKLDKEYIEQILCMLVKRHESLRTSFDLYEGQPVQRIHEKVDFHLETVNVKDGEEAAIERFIRPFDIKRAPLFRAGLMEVSCDKHVLIVDMHHIISDGISVGILINDFTKLYNKEPLPQLKLQYKDFSHWQKVISEKSILKEQEAYWLEVFSGDIPILNMPADELRPSVQSFEGSSISFETGRELAEGLYKISAENKGTLYMTLLAAFNVLLSRYSGQEDIVIGSPVAGRPHTDLENIIGVFVNTLAMRNYPYSNKTVREFMREVRESTLKAYENQDYQFEVLVEKLDIRRDLSRNPLFDAAFVMQNMGWTSLSLQGLKINSYEIVSRVAKFDLTLNAVERNQNIYFTLEYSTKLFHKETIERLSRHLTAILQEFVQYPDKQISQIDMLSEEEKEQLLFGFNQTDADYPKDKTIHGIFEERTEEWPDNTAVVFKDTKITYRELNSKANRIARNLAEKGVIQDSIVGLLMEPSIEMIAGILGILKAGGAYLPIDPEYPEERIRFMLQDSGAKVLLVQRSSGKWDGYCKTVLEVEEAEMTPEEVLNIDFPQNPQQLAYVIYTSGTTGNPKGVMIEHYNVVRLLFNGRMQFDFSQKDVWTLFHSYCFDFSVWEMYGALLYGGTLVVVPRMEAKDTRVFLKLLKDMKVTVLNQTPTAFYGLAREVIKHEAEDLCLRYVIFGGEALKPSMLMEFRERYPDTRLINMYGITETTVHVTYKEITERDILLNRSNIGKPIPTLTLYIMNKDMKLQPVGVPGELCVGGAGLGRGYLNRPELTNERFVTNPYVQRERMYRSGDLARMLPDGEVEYLGRIDRQVKIRGHRIELGEIESALSKYPGILNVVATVRNDPSGDTYITAYMEVKAEDGNQESFSANMLRSYLKQSLPDYMIPSYYRVLDRIPLNQNRKVDYKALPDSMELSGSMVQYDTPENGVEEKLAAIWKGVLGVEEIGTTSNFFEFGGHSLKAMAMISKIHEEFNVQIPLSRVFENQTIKELAKLMEEGEEDRYRPIDPCRPKDFYPLSAAQKRLYILHQLNKNSTAYNVPGVVEIEGQVDIKRLEETFYSLELRHEALRTYFTTFENEPVQCVEQSGVIKVEYIHMDEFSIEEVIRQFIRPFDLYCPPLIRVCLAKVKDGKQYLLFDMHHIITDGTSIGILIRDFVSLYEGTGLPELRIQYKDFAVWQSRRTEEELKKQEEYWLKLFSGKPPKLNMPVDFIKTTVQQEQGALVEHCLDGELSDRLKEFALQNGVTLYMVLLSVYNVLLSKYSGQTDIVVGTPVAGRLHPDLKNIIGMFVNTLAIRNRPEEEKTFYDLLYEVKSNVLSAFEHQEYPFEDLVYKLGIQGSSSENPLFDTMFAMQNMNMPAFSIDGLTLKPFSFDQGTTQFDMILHGYEDDEGISFKLYFRTCLYEKRTMELFLQHFENIVRTIIVNGEILIGDIRILSEKEQKELSMESSKDILDGIHIDFDMDTW